LRHAALFAARLQQKKAPRSFDHADWVSDVDLSTGEARRSGQIIM
jgi:hypothetical protein